MSTVSESEETRTLRTATSSGGGVAKLARIVGDHAASAVVALARCVHAERAAKARLDRATEALDLAAARKATSAAKRAAHKALCAANFRSAIVCRGVRVRVSPLDRKNKRPKSKPLDPAAARAAIMRACETTGLLDTDTAARIVAVAMPPEEEEAQEQEQAQAQARTTGESEQEQGQGQGQEQEAGKGKEKEKTGGAPTVKTTKINVELIDA